MKLLALDTASAQCSVALLQGDALLTRVVATARGHAQLLLPLVDEVLAEAGLAMGLLDGIAFGRGPGSFTGVRIAAAVTQGLALGADLPVMPVSDLRALAERARRASAPADDPSAHVLGCMDARMGEVYWGAFACTDPILPPQAGQEHVGSAESLVAAFPGRCVAAAGLGLAAWPQLASLLAIPPAAVHADFEPLAEDVARLAARDLAQGAQWLDAALAQPVYLRDQVAFSKT